IQLIGAHENGRRFSMGEASDRNFASRYKMTHCLFRSVRLEKMAPQQRAHGLRVGIALNKGAYQIMNLAALGEGHHAINDVSQNRMPEREFVRRSVGRLDDA